MPARCAVAGCSNTNKDGVAVHKFPKENKLKAQWTRFVKLTRADFTQPTQCQYQTICEVHFTSDCYDQKYKIKQTLGFSEKSKKLLPGSVPSIYPKIIKDSVTICTPPTKKRKTLTSHKRDIHRMIQHEIDPSNSSICDLDNPLLEEQAASTSSLLDISKDRTTLLQNAVKSVMVQASPKCKEKGTNYSYKPYYRSVGVQVDESEFKKISREQASTRDGQLKYDVIFPKYKKGDYIVRECKKATSYGYEKRLVSYAAEKCESHNRTRIDVNVPPPLCLTYYHPQKEEAVKMKTSRFANK